MSDAAARPSESGGWTVVVPVKGTPAAKSRLSASAALARAIARDTVEAVIAATLVRRVIVVTSADGPPDFEALGAEVVADPSGGLADAITAGLAAAGQDRVAVLLGDLPALDPDELDAAIVAAATHPLAFVPDADGVGTSLITAVRASDHRPAFGAGSRNAHRAAGYVELELSIDSGLRRDVDTRDHLDELAEAGRLGPRTALVRRVEQDDEPAEVDSLNP